MIRTTAASALFALAMLAAAPANASPTDDLRAAMLRFAELSSYEMTVGNAGKTAVIDFAKPDAMRMSAQGMQMVQIGHTTYMNMGGKWQKFASRSGAGPMEMANRVRSLARESNGVSATDLGMKSVGGETLHAYKMTQKDGTTGIIYIGRDGLPHRMQGKDADQAITFSKFNQVPAIRAPM